MKLNAVHSIVRKHAFEVASGNMKAERSLIFNEYARGLGRTLYIKMDWVRFSIREEQRNESENHLQQNEIAHRI